ncbi:phage portal protein [Clostridium scatologenes]|uniref:Phage portal protein, SPP1 n=1 Tax=Clostridium scatologenes TaxID=1548 RepID=A0A0E3M870_CLOSL|nr:phage portal protein [Clostridium scatologenes]AKA71213.1 phage portal protein, SPP1 [Clostridium scatologenes]
MQTLEQYIQNKYNSANDWFVNEVNQPWHMNRVSKVLQNRDYLKGVHKILEREDSKWKGEVFNTTKLILQESKTILNFHDTYLLGKKVSLTGSDDIVATFNNVYRKGKYNKIDFDILRKVNRFGDIFEYVYLDGGVIKSKLINSEDSYPIFSEDTGEYIGFIEYYTMDSNKVSYYNVYYMDHVECYNNENSELQLINEYNNISGLPIHYKNFNDYDEHCGLSELEDIKPILDQLEDILSKMTDAVYTLSLNPIPVSVGQRIEGTIPSDACGYSISIDAGEFKFVNAQMDYSTIKLLLDTLHKKLETIAGIPSVALGNSNVANVSEVSLSMLYSLASVKAMINEQWLREGFETRWEIIRKLLALQGIVFSEDEFIDCEFNYSRPINNQETLSNIKTQFDMGAISLQTIIEKSYLTNDVTGEMDRIEKEKINNVQQDLNNTSDIK